MTHANDESEPDKPRGLTRGTVIMAFVLAAAVGMPASCIGEEIAGAPAWGSLLCPEVCADCRGPGRTVFWNSSKSGDHSIALCHNPRIDIEKISGSAAEKYPEITLSWWWRTPLTLLVLTALGLTVRQLARARRARRARRA